MMKTTLGSVVMLVFLLSANPLFVAPEAVIDIEGEEVKVGVDYYIVSAIRGAGGGGVNLGRNRNDTLCPLDVIQERSDLNRGLPVTFSPVDNPENGVVQLQTDLNIEFSVPGTFCREPTVWKLEQSFVTTGGVKGNPGKDTLSNWFKIEKFSTNNYKLVFCPSVCDFCKVQCGDIGRFFDKNGVTRLVRSDDSAFNVVFVKAKISTTSSI